MTPNRATLTPFADVGWLSEQLGEEVAEVEIDPVALGGAFCTLRRLSVRFVAGGERRFVAKAPREDAATRDTARALGLFERERRFYAELAPRCPVAVPACAYAGPPGTEQLLLEDLGALRGVDQVDGAGVADAARVIDALARLHAAHWEGVRTEPLPAWLVGAEDRAFAQMACAIAARGAPVLCERYRDRLSAAALDGVRRAGARFDAVLGRCARGPLTLVHGDARIDNVLFRADGSPVFIDWQVPARARGTQDVAYVLSTSLRPADQAAHALALLERWHARIGSLGVHGYAWDDCVRHYREHVLYSLFAAFALMGTLDVGEGRTARLADALVLRNVGHAEAIGAFAVLSRENR
ncbi:MAG TPA: phosphotransferase [Nevskiaceae bacterium]|nr:phosphotransferase [Nevskiaceae bacterium]